MSADYLDSGNISQYKACAKITGALEKTLSYSQDYFDLDSIMVGKI